MGGINDEGRSARVGPSMRMAIDMPSSGAIVQQPFTVAGGDPTFLGVADSGDSRPDVAETYGGQFERSSFSLIANALQRGTYNVVVYPHRASTGTFEGAQSVRVVVP